MNSESLSSLLWWIVIAAVFFWMMRRGGCGMMGHGGGRHQSRHGDESDQVRSAGGPPIDPVCRMAVEPARAAGTRVVAGHIYFFCSPTCVDAFERQPELYTGQREAQTPQHTGG